MCVPVTSNSRFSLNTSMTDEPSCKAAWQAVIFFSSGVSSLCTFFAVQRNRKFLKATETMQPQTCRGVYSGTYQEQPAVTDLVPSHPPAPLGQQEHPHNLWRRHGEPGWQPASGRLSSSAKGWQSCRELCWGEQARTKNVFSQHKYSCFHRCTPPKMRAKSDWSSTCCRCFW